MKRATTPNRTRATKPKRLVKPKKNIGRKPPKKTKGSKKPKLAYSFIRFSSKRQELGDSLRRQVTRTEQYAREKGLALDEETRLRALGISGFTGAHIKQGTALGGFLKALEEGKIPTGTALIVESLDRLSRMRVTQAFKLFCSILEAGVEIHTLIDRQVYTQDSLNDNPGQIFASIGALYGAHAESAQRGVRVREKWEMRKKKAKEQVVTKRVPYWLTVVEDKIVSITDRVTIVRDIFEMKLAHKGKYLIAKDLNERKVKTWGKGQEWHPSYVHKILRNPAVVGDYQPMRRVEGKRYKDGKVVRNYYPQIISRDDFDAAQDNLPKGRKGGERSGTVNNVFSGLVYSGVTGRKMYYTNKNSLSNWQYLTDRAKTSVQYWGFESRACGLLDELDWDEIDRAGDAKLETLNKEVEALRTKQAEVGEEAERITLLLNKDVKLDEIVLRARELEKQREALNKQAEELQKTRKTIARKPGIQTFSVERNEKRNLQLRALVHKLVKKITVYNINDFQIELRDGKTVRYNPAADLKRVA